MIKIFKIILPIILCIVLTVPCFASSYTAYDGTFSTTYLEYFKGMVYKLPSDAHYVVFRGSQYDYYLAYNTDWTVNGTRFNGVGLTTIIRYSTQNGNYILSTNTDSSFTLNASDDLIYTDLADTYPALVDAHQLDRSDTNQSYIGAILVLVAVFLLIYVGFSTIRKRWII